jgi:hypothetical protein
MTLQWHKQRPSLPFFRHALGVLDKKASYVPNHRNELEERGGFMKRPKDMFRWQTTSGDKVTVGDVTVTPQSQALTIRWPNGGLVWNRPAAVLVERGEQTERIPIVDVTRIAQLGLLGLSLVFTMMAIVLSVRRRRE